jgi:GntR family transcriptional regulator, rspAB operon transcriptional repressor
MSRRTTINVKAYAPYKDQIYKRLKAKILLNELHPGSLLTENGLAQSFGTSRTPIREAIHQLQSEGLVEVIPKKGIFVTSMDPKDVEDINEIREVIHCHAIKKGIDRIRPSDIVRFKEMLEKAEGLIRDRKVSRLVILSMHFHRLILKLARNKRLIELDSVLRNYRVRYSVELYNMEEGMETAWRGHRQIVEALEKRDADLACRLMGEHIRWGTASVEHTP